MTVDRRMIQKGRLRAHKPMKRYGFRFTLNKLPSYREGFYNETIRDSCAFKFGEMGATVTELYDYFPEERAKIMASWEAYSKPWSK